jgi:hypothetical protein
MVQWFQNIIKFSYIPIGFNVETHVVAAILVFGSKEKTQTFYKEHCYQVTNPSSMRFEKILEIAPLNQKAYNWSSNNVEFSKTKIIHIHAVGHVKC